jgi:flagellar biosynthetic protein FliQ
MDGDFVLYISRRTLEVALLLAAPCLVVALGVGLLTAMLQAVTSIRDMTLGMVMKIFGIGVTVLVFGGWMLQIAMGFTQEIFNHMRQMVS